MLERFDCEAPCSRRLFLRLLAGMLVIATAWSVTNTAPAGAQEPIGKSIRVKNSVTGTVQGQRPLQLQPEKEVFQQEIIDALEDSSSLLQFYDNSQLAICPTGEVDIQKELNPRALFIYLSKSCARYSSGELENEARIITPNAEIKPLGTIITVVVSSRGTTVSVEEGAASVTGAGRTVTVPVGQSTLVLRGAPPTPPVPSPPLPPIVSQMDRLLASASVRDFGTRAAARSPEVEAPHGGNMLSPNVDGKIQSEIAGDATPAFGCAGSAGTLGSRGTHGACGSRGTH